MARAIDTYPRNDKRIKRNIVKIRNPDVELYGDGKKFLYFQSQRDAVDWFLVNCLVSHDDLPYDQLESRFSYNLANYEEFNGIECKHHNGSGSTLMFEPAPDIH